jgi:hypothetical protein
MKQIKIMLIKPKSQRIQKQNNIKLIRSLKLAMFDHQKILNTKQINN